MSGSSDYNGACRDTIKAWRKAKSNGWDDRSLYALTDCIRKERALLDGMQGAGSVSFMRKLWENLGLINPTERKRIRSVALGFEDGETQ